MDLQEPTRKMSTTGGTEQGTVRLLDAPDVIAKKFKTAVTDSGREIVRAADKPGISNLIDILSVATDRSPEEIETAYEGVGYGQFKTDVGDAVLAMFAPVRERYEALRADETALLDRLREGAAKAEAVATPTLETMYERMGFVRL